MIHYSPFDAATIADPYPIYRQLRADAPLYVSPSENFVAVSRHPDVAAVLRDDLSFSSELGVTLHPADQSAADYPFPVLLLDSPGAHRSLKQRLLARFKPLEAERLRKSFVNNAHRILSTIESAHIVDIVSDYIEPFAISCFADIASVAHDRRPEFARHIACALARNPSDARNISVDAMKDRLSEGKHSGIIQFMMSHVSDMRAVAEGCPYVGTAAGDLNWTSMSDSEVAGVAYMATMAGIEDVIRTIAGAIPILRGALSAKTLEIELLESDGRVVDELARLVSSTQYLRRTVTRETVMHGMTLLPGTRIVAIMGSANRDESVFPDADKFDVRRANLNKVLAFGTGPHMCLGLNIAKVMIGVALEALFKAFPDCKADLDSRVIIHSFNVVGIYSMNVRLQ